LRIAIYDTVQFLATWPSCNADIKKLQDRDGYRLRIGAYRVIFDIDQSGNPIIVNIMQGENEMKTHTNVQILKCKDGKPAFAVIPYSDYLAMPKHKAPAIPNDVVGKVIKQGMTPIRAWREYLGRTQTDIASELGISQAAYARQENSARLRKSTKEKIAHVLGLALEQLDV